MAFQAAGQQQLQPWLGAFEARVAPRSLLGGGGGGSGGGGGGGGGGNSGAAMMNLVYLDGWLFSTFSSFFAASVRRSLPPTLADKSAIVFSRSERTTDVRALAAAESVEKS